jgi:NitT/TauT family transport system substrate-binding protein
VEARLSARSIRRLAAAAFAGAVALAAPAAAESIKIGLLRVPASGPVYVATERGYFAAEGLAPQLVYFESGPPVAVGVVSGDLDFGAGALIGAFYNLAGQGALRLIGALSREVPTFQGQGYLVNKRQYDAGFTSLKQFAGHSVAVTAVGGPAHYAVGLLAEKYGFGLARVRIVVTQSLTNAVAAVEIGQTDTTVISMTAALPPILQRGDVKLLGWVGDETPWQYGAIFTAKRTADGKRDMVERFLRAYRHGAKDYHDAFTGPDGRRSDGPAAPEILAILAKYIGQSVENVKFSITYADPEARLDVKDVLHQIDWYRGQGMIKGDVNGAELIDMRYAQDLAGP